MKRKLTVSRKCRPPRKDLPGIYKWPLEEAYWDCRNIAPEDVAVATFYEYAASCDWIRREWDAWIGEAFPKWKKIWPPGAPATVVWDEHRTQPISDVLAKFSARGIRTNEGDEVVKRLLAAVPEPLNRCGFPLILQAAPNFPTPWLNLSPSTKARLKSRLKQARIRPSAFHVFSAREPSAYLRADPEYENSIFEVLIDWRRLKNDIKEDFQKWLGLAYHEFRMCKKEKAKHSDGYQHLRRLCAWRLHRCDLTYIPANEILKKRSSTRPKYPQHDLPITTEGTWKNFHTQARDHCELLFPEPDSHFLDDTPSESSH